jgi:hypothetical protein
MLQLWWDRAGQSAADRLDVRAHPVVVQDWKLFFGLRRGFAP